MENETETADEIGAMGEIIRILEPFDAQTKKRMLEWVVAREASLVWCSLPDFPESDDIVRSI